VESFWIFLLFLTFRDSFPIFIQVNRFRKRAYPMGGEGVRFNKTSSSHLVYVSFSQTCWIGLLYLERPEKRNFLKMHFLQFLSLNYFKIFTNMSYEFVCPLLPFLVSLIPKMLCFMRAGQGNFRFNFLLLIMSYFVNNWSEHYQLCNQ